MLPGTALFNLLHELGVDPQQSCNCAELAEVMDDLGVEGCRKVRGQLIAKIKRNARRYGWKDFAKAAFRAIKLGLAFKINPLDPVPDLFDEAMRRAS